MKLQTQFFAIFISLGLFGLGGCASTQSDSTLAELEISSSDQAQSSEADAQTAPKAEDYPIASFEGDSLYRLLVAEVAGYRRDFETALEEYLIVAAETKDPGVAARATRLAAYLKDAESELYAAQIWAESDPDNIYAHRHATDKLMRAGRLEEAVLHMEAVRNLGGLANFEVFAYRAASLDQDSKLSLLQALNALNLRHPDDNQIIFSRAVLLRQTGDLDEALTQVNRLLKDDVETDEALLKVNILKNLSRPEEAASFLENTLEATDNPDRRLRLIFARLLYDIERLDEAKVQYEAVLEITPSDGNVLFVLALIAMEQKNTEVAKDYLQRMVRWNQRTGEAHFYLGTLAELDEDTGQAISEYKLVSQGYEYISAQGRIAGLLVQQGKLSEMRAHMANIRAENPDSRNELLILEAQLLAEEGLKDEVFKLLDDALLQTPDEIDLLYYRGMVGQRFERLDILERDLQRVIALEPNNSDALNALGYTLADQTERYDEALGLIQRALEIKPDEAAFIDSMGWVLYRLKDFEQAAVHLRRALELFVNDEVAAHLGEVLWVKGEREEANAVWNRALDTTPDSEILKKVIERFVTQ